MKTFDVFISYSRRDYVDENKQIIPGNIVSKIKELFDTHGITYWFDEDGIYSGDAFAPMIARNIKLAKVFLFISSENSNASEWTSNEIATAHAYQKKILPFKYDNSVYNDSIILYIARLDYIEYAINPQKSMERLLSSVKNYLREVNETEERERMEQERRREDEKSRQERATKLQLLREKIATLENRKYDIEKEILMQDKALTDLKNEKRILEANILDLQEEVAALTGEHSSTKTEYKKTETEDKATGEEEVSRIVVPETQKKNIFVRLWDDLLECLSKKHWLLNTVCITDILISIFFIIWFFVDALIEEFSLIVIVIYFLTRLFTVIQIVRNRTTVTSFLSSTLIALAIIFFPIVSIDDEAVISMFFILVLTLIIYPLLMLLRKNGVSAWQLMLKRKEKKQS